MLTGKRSRGPPAGSEEQGCKRRRREIRQLQRYTFAEAEHMRQEGYNSWAISPEVPAAMRRATVAQLIREFTAAWQRHTGRLVQSKDEGAAHAMERLIFVPEHEGAVRGIRTSITTQKLTRGPHLGLRLWVHGRPAMVAVFATAVTDCFSTEHD